MTGITIDYLAFCFELSLKAPVWAMQSNLRFSNYDLRLWLIILVHSSSEMACNISWYNLLGLRGIDSPFSTIDLILKDRISNAR